MPKKEKEKKQETKKALTIQERNDAIVLAKSENVPVRTIAEEYGLSVGTVYQVLRSYGIVTRKKGSHECIECQQEFMKGKLRQDEIKPAIARDLCLKHYQRRYRNLNKERMREKDSRTVRVAKPDGTFEFKTMREVRLAAHREAQRRYCQRHPERLKETLTKYRQSPGGKEAAKRAVARYREKKSAMVFKEILAMYQLEDAGEASRPLAEEEPQDQLEVV